MSSDYCIMNVLKKIMKKVLLALFILIPVFIGAYFLYFRNIPNLPLFSPPVRSIARPIGIYAVISINEFGDFSPEETKKILGNEAVSGIAIRERWRNLEPKEGQYDFSRIDGVLKIASEFNSKKTVQLILVPGFYSPGWLMDKPLVGLCDSLINGDINLDGKQPPGCGSATFEIPYGPDSGNESLVYPLPLPWNKEYKERWKKFLTEVAKKYNNNSQVVSVAVAGPTSVSAEMSMPDDIKKWSKILALFYPEGDPHRDSDLVFIEEWKNAIEMYNKIFHNKTIIVTEGSGLPKFTKGDPRKAKEEIVDYFVDKAVFASNIKGAQTSGLKACRDFEGGIGKIKQTTSKGILGGAQFNSSATKNPSIMGCTDKNICGRQGKNFCETQGNHQCCSLNPNEAIANVLKIYFEDTLVGDSMVTSTGVAKMSYLQVYAADIVNANDKSGFPGVYETFVKASKLIREMAVP